nr:MAG TPA: hypothetical protein [Caudoviricetes sp.]
MNDVIAQITKARLIETVLPERIAPSAIMPSDS